MERFFESFKTHLLTEKKVARNTFVAYVGDIQHFLQFIEQYTTGEGATREQLQKYAEILYNKQLSAASRARKIASIKSFYSYMHHYHNQENTASCLELPKVPSREPRVVSEEDILKLLAVAEYDHSLQGIRNRVLVNLLYLTGMSISELANLTLSDIDFEEQKVLVRGRRNRERCIPLATSMVFMLKEYGNLLDRSKSDYLFPISFGGRVGPITRQACWLIIKKLWEKTGIQKEVSPQVIRHSLATHMLKQGTDPKDLQQLLGHRDCNAIMQYKSMEPSLLRALYDKKHPRS